MPSCSPTSSGAQLRDGELGGVRSAAQCTTPTSGRCDVTTLRLTEIRQTLLRLFFASIALNTVLGIWALLANDFGRTQGKVLATSFLVSGTMLGVLVNTPVARRSALRWLAGLAGSAFVVGVAVFLGLIWFENDAAFGMKFGASALVIGGASTLGGLLAILPLRRSHRPFRGVAAGLIAALALTVIWVLWTDPGGDWAPRLVGVEGVLVAAAAVVLPVVSRFEGSGFIDVVGPEPTYCPFCGQAAVGTARADGCLRCPRCALVYRVRLAEHCAGGASAPNR